MDAFPPCEVMRLSKPAETIGVRANNAINDMVRPTSAEPLYQQSRLKAMRFTD